MKIRLLSVFSLLFFIMGNFLANAETSGKTNDFIIFSIDSNSSIATDLEKELKISLGKMNIERFKDGEISVKLSQDVHFKDCIVISTSDNSPNENLMELLITIDTLKRNFASKVLVLMPYFMYSRQDRQNGYGEGISAKLVANLIKTAGADGIITVDLHASQEEGFFDIPVMNLKGLDLFLDYFKNAIIDNKDDFVIVAPDIGASKKAREFAEKLDCTVAIIDKHRPRPNECEVVGVYGDVSGKKAILIDDMVDTAGTICNAAKILTEKGATEVYACATHAILSGDATEKIKKSPIKKFVFLDTISHSSSKTPDKIYFLPSAKIFAKALKKFVNC